MVDHTLADMTTHHQNSIAAARFCEVDTLHVFMVQIHLSVSSVFSILCHDNTVLIVWLVQAQKNIWL